MIDLICPKDATDLHDLTCDFGHVFPVYHGIPVLLRDDVPATCNSYARSFRILSDNVEPSAPCSDIEEYVQEMVASAAGHLYVPLIGKLTSYPIPDLPLPGGDDLRLLDVGTNWGRWAIAAAIKGYEVTAIDSSLEALVVAQRVAHKLNAPVTFVCADARYLPFKSDSFDQGFSFSVLQHFSKADARLAFGEMKRVACQNMVEMPGKFGIRALYHQAKRGFSEGVGFNVRYWTPSELKSIGKISVHAYFGTGILSCDAYLLPLKYRMIVSASDCLRSISRLFPPLQFVADSYYVTF